ncbi:unnamed protein product [Linum tenue]|nr:unnamed protein product [Linum tenue]
MDLEDDVCLATFDNDQDYFKALTGGPWVLLDHYLIVHQWSPEFRVGEAIPRTVTTWVRFPHLPVHFYHKEVLFALGNLIGRTIKLDYHTEHGHRGKFARIAIELDMSKPLKPRIRLDGFWQKVVYENLPNACFGCGIVGHAESICPKLGRDLTATASDSTTTISSQTLPLRETEAPVGFGPWMQVTRKSRKPERKDSSQQAADQAKLQGSKSGKKNQPQKEGEFNLPSLGSNKPNAKGKNIGHSHTTAKAMELPNQAKNQEEIPQVGMPNMEKVEKKNENGKKATMNPPVSAPVPTTILKQNPSPLAVHAGDKGLLGPGPQPASGSPLLDPSSSKQSLNKAPKSDKTTASGPSLEGIKTRTVFGPDGKTVTILDVSCPEPPSHRQIDPEAPLSSLRIKKKKKKKGSSPRPTKQGMPMAAATKAIQIWSPKKDKKNKPRDKLLSLTLQEIEAWSSTTRNQSATASKFSTGATATIVVESEPSPGNADLAKEP